MKLSELKKEIDRFITKHGDLEAVVEDDGVFDPLASIEERIDFDGNLVAVFSEYVW